MVWIILTFVFGAAAVFYYFWSRFLGFMLKQTIKNLMPILKVLDSVPQTPDVVEARKFFKVKRNL